MLFNSIDFAVFLPVVFVLYWCVFRGRKQQNALLLLASSVFYGWWDWRYLVLVFFSTGVDYVIGLRLGRTDDERHRKVLLVVSLVANLGLLGFFKYTDFLITAFNDAFTLFGHPLGIGTLSVILPVGISFYTFQSLSYTIDVYRRQIRPAPDVIEFGAFVLFFPQLVAGPIERAAHLLPQFAGPRTFEITRARDGLRQILWGLFKKIVVADNCAQLVNEFYAAPSDYHGSSLALATVLFAFQIYCDFSGYSDIAIGTARLFGFNLMRNFNVPYFSRDIAEFWRRWHISLNTWFRDYVYIPLGGSRGSKAFVVRNTLVIFIVSGFWHGANWTFLAWGALNAIFFLPLLLLSKHRSMTGTVAKNRALPSLREFGMMALTFAMTCFAWIFFRAADMGQAFDVIARIGSASLFAPLEISNMLTLWICCLGIGIVVVLEWINRSRQYGLRMDGRLTRPLRNALYYGLILIILACAPTGGGEFIYFQF